MTGGFRVKRIYEAPSPQDGQRVLVDRLWPRGISKERAHLDEWAKDAAPSAQLRRWLHAAPHDRHDQFARRYTAELDGPVQRHEIDELRSRAAKETVTLLTAVKDIEDSHIPVLLQRLGT
jgi:uncharacterized protein YeaO (DUF488 family)